MNKAEKQPLPSVFAVEQYDHFPPPDQRNNSVRSSHKHSSILLTRAHQDTGTHSRLLLLLLLLLLSLFVFRLARHDHRWGGNKSRLHTVRCSTLVRQVLDWKRHRSYPLFASSLTLVRRTPRVSKASSTARPRAHTIEGVGTPRHRTISTAWLLGIVVPRCQPARPPSQPTTQVNPPAPAHSGLPRQMFQP